MNPLVTVIMPVYNAGKYLSDSVDSILNQSYNNIELILVDDGSTDGCIEALTETQLSKLKLIRQENSGKSVALNNALKICNGKYYCIQDADDLADNNRIKSLTNLMENKKHLAAVFSGYNLIVNNRKVAPLCKLKYENDCKNDIENFRMPSHDPTGFYRVEMVKDALYDPEQRIGQGYDYILRIGERFPIEVLPECLYSYRIDIDSTTRNNDGKRETMIMMVWAKACNRRKIIFSQWMAQNEIRLVSLRKGSGQYGLVSHCMESVVLQKKNRQYLNALLTALLTISYGITKITNWKPLLYFLTPNIIIEKYRKIKSN